MTPQAVAHAGAEDAVLQHGGVKKLLCSAFKVEFVQGVPLPGEVSLDVAGTEGCQAGSGKDEAQEVLFNLSKYVEVEDRLR